MSVTTTSGRRSSTASSRESRSSQEATTSMSPCPASSCAMPSRTRRLSSASATLMVTAGMQSAPVMVEATVLSVSVSAFVISRRAPLLDRAISGTLAPCPSPVRVLVVDDHPIVRSAMRVLLDAAGEFRGRRRGGLRQRGTERGRAARSRPRAPGTVRMPDMDGIEGRLADSRPRTTGRSWCLMSSDPQSEPRASARRPVRGEGATQDRRLARALVAARAGTLTHVVDGHGQWGVDVRHRSTLTKVAPGGQWRRHAGSARVHPRVTGVHAARPDQGSRPGGSRARLGPVSGSGGATSGPPVG
jgi:hypothetical protein